MPGSGDDIVLAAVGDVMVNRDEPASLFEHSRSVLVGADVTFGNCESVYAENGARNPAARGETRAHPRNAEALRDAGFDAPGCAPLRAYTSSGAPTTCSSRSDATPWTLSPGLPDLP